MNVTESLKKKLLALQQTINNSYGVEKIVFNQQTKVKENMSFSGCNGRLWIQPFHDEYDVSLSGQSLEKQLTQTMTQLFDKKHDGFKQANATTGDYRQPYWRTSNFTLVEKAVELYAKTNS